MINSLAYVGVVSPAYREWEVFGPEVLGLQVAERGADGAVRLRMDEAEWRLAVHPGDKNDVAYIGWNVAGPDDARQIVDRVTATGRAVAEADRDEARDRGVAGFWWFLDPAGFRHEVSWGQWTSPATFSPGRPMSGFRTGAQGLGHIVLLVPDLDEGDAFYRCVMGLRISDTVFEKGRELRFFHVNGRHHSLAIGSLGGPVGVTHIMMEVNSLSDVGTAIDICTQRDIPITRTLGEHTNDRMVSFYVATPSAFRIEYGHGGAEIDNLWVPKTYNRASIWGHINQFTELPWAMIIDRADARTAV